LSSAPRHLVTGATGFVGAALILELLTHTQDAIVAVVRPGAVGARPRLVEAVQHAARIYGRDPEGLPLARLEAVEGDVSLPACGAAGTVGRVDVLWHSAASLRFEDRYAAEIMATNFGGTREVLALARAAGAQVANLISTAYVVGSAEGVQREVAVQAAASNNHYERSKVAAEELALQCQGLKVRIFRPSIVVGHSHTLAATTFSGLYGFTRQLFQFRGVMQRMQADLLTTRPLRLRVSPDAPLNLVPVDAVAEQAAHIGLQSGAEGIYHLTEPSPPSIGEAILAVTRALGLADPEFVAPDAPLEWLDEQLDKRLVFYSSYIRGHKVFERSRTDAALEGYRGPAQSVPSVDRLVAWYLEHLEAERADQAPHR